MNYSELHLHEHLQKGILEAGYVECTPVQQKVLLVSLGGADLYVQSQTGTGKTAAYLLTIMQQLLSGEGAEKKALVLVPTRELAVQVEDEARKIGKYTNLSFASFYGGVGYEKQLDSLKAGVNVIIGTPGRIIDLQERNKMDLSRVAFLALDEADRMFDMGFYPDLRKLIHRLPASEKRQTMLFSATLNTYVKNLAYEYTRGDAVEITIEAENITVDEIDQELIHVSSEEKLPLLLGIIAREKPESLIIFCNTKKMCEVLAKRLRINGIESDFLIGDLPQKKRLKIMTDFKAGKTKCLVATDVAARGIDVNDLAMVVNYDLPNEAENYVHRIGRTARAGKSGKAYTLCSEQDVYQLVSIERYIEKKIPSSVAVQEDFYEDKSRDMWIKTGDWSEEGDGSFSSHSKKERKSGKNRHKTETRKGERKEGERRGKNKKRGEKSHASEEEIQKISSMTSDERLAYFKEKYAGNRDANAQSQKKSDRKKQRKRSENAISKNTPKNTAVSTVKSISAQSQKIEAPKKKMGFFERLKSLIGRGK